MSLDDRVRKFEEAVVEHKLLRLYEVQVPKIAKRMKLFYGVRYDLALKAAEKYQLRCIQKYIARVYKE